MKKLNAYISGLLGLVMVVAVLLPSMHAFSHEIDQDAVANETKVVPVTIECELCDFHFSTWDSPVYLNYYIYLPVKETVYSQSIKDTVYPYTPGLFSLRAPPAVIA